MDDWRRYTDPTITLKDKAVILSWWPFHRPPQAWPAELPPLPAMEADPRYLYLLMTWQAPSFLATLPYDYSETFDDPLEAVDLADELGRSADCNRAAIVMLRRGEPLPELVPYATATWRGIGFHWTLAKAELK